MSQSADDTEIVRKAVRLACLKAFASMLSNNFSKNCLTTAAVAACILGHYKVPFKVVVGYFQFLPTSFPHVWLETEPDCVTDLSYSDVARKIVILGQGIGFHDDAVRPTYSRTPALPVFEGSPGGAKPMPISVIAEVAKNLGQYLEQSPPYVQREVTKTLASAFDGSDEIKIDPKGLSSVAALAPS